jgi:hypothetical protein
MAVMDYIVIGSGCTGAMAAQTLVEKGVRVTMLDGGVTDTKYARKIPNEDYLSIKKKEPDQYEYFIGKDFEGIPFGDIKTGEHLTPPRKFMLYHVRDWMPLISDNFFPLESLSLGGLGNAWGLGSCIFSKQELEEAGLDPVVMSSAYETVGKRIGISATRDDTAQYTAGLLNEFMPSIEMDSTGKNLMENYRKKKNKLNKHGFFMGRTSLALLTRDMDGRKGYRYKDLDFYCDQDKSAYRPWLTVDELKKQANFDYRGGLVVLKFSEKDDVITVECRAITNNEPVSFQCKKLLICSSCLSTARIVLRSYEQYDVRLPVISNPYSYLPAIQPYLLGKDTDERKIGFAQLSLFYDPAFTNMDVGMASIYSYRSLMAFHILKETPMSTKAGYAFLQYMMPAFTIAGLFHTEKGSASKYLCLKKDGSQLSGDALHVNYDLSDAEKSKVAHNERKFTQALRQLNCFVMKKINPGQGSGIHYAGTLPFSSKNEKFKLLPTGKLGETRNVYIADGSGFNYLPAKGLTFSLMANAHNVALNALQE